MVETGGIELGELCEGRRGAPLTASRTSIHSRKSLNRAVLHPMDEDTYRIVLEYHRRFHTVTFHKSGESDYKEGELKLRQDLARNKVVWSGRWRTDLWLYLINMNPVLAPFFSHPLHPISRKRRLLVYAMSFLCVIRVATTAAMADVCDDCDMKSCGAPFSCDLGEIQMVKTRFPSVGKPELWLPDVCCRVSWLGVLQLMDLFGDALGLMIFSMVANAAFSICCFQLVMCPCVQQLSMGQRRIGEFVGGSLFAILGVISIITSKELIILKWEKRWDRGGIMRTLKFVLGAKLTSWIGVTFFNCFLFAVLFGVQYPKAANSRRKWMDPPIEYGAEDHRSSLVKALNPRYHVLACEFMEFQNAVDTGKTQEVIGEITDPDGISDTELSDAGD